MFCAKCGKELLDEAVICPNCGCATGKPQTAIHPYEQAENPAKGILLILAGIAVIVVFILLVMSQL